MPPKTATKAAPGKKGVKAPNALVAKLKMKMEKDKEAEERRKQEEEELERQAREEEKLLQEQRKLEEEEKRREKERKEEEAKRLKKEEKKTKTKKGPDLSRYGPNAVLPDLEKIRQEQEEMKDQPKPKPKPKPKLQQQAQQHVDPAAEAKEEESDGEKSVPTESDADIDEEDWEAVAERDERREERHKENIRIRAEREERRKVREEEKKQKEKEEQEAMGKVSDLRSPICCVLGHVDAGKTSLLDRVRSTNVQGGEAGGITQQIGATFIPQDALITATTDLNQRLEDNLKVSLDVPGLLIIDTPGHESFTNLRSRGSSLCDIAILVVDINNGLQKQTRESIRLLKERKCPFIVALNKIDSMYSWAVNKNMDSVQTLGLQKPNVQQQFASQVRFVKNQLAEEGFNSELYYENDDVRKTISIVPLSARTGEGISDLLLLTVKLVKRFMEGKVTYKNEVQCTVLEVKPIVGHGMTIDVILINGVLHENDPICLCGQDGPIFTNIRYLMTPQPMRETRVKGDFVHHKEIKAAMGVKIAANDLENVIPGTQLYLVRPGDDKEELGKQVMKDASNIKEYLCENGDGITVQSSTLGALEAILTFLKENKIPVANAFIGPMHKRHILQVISIKNKFPRHGVVLAFDTTVSPDAEEIAEKNQIPIFKADVIYHLFDRYIQYEKDYEEQERQRLRDIAVFPVELKTIDDAIREHDPIILPVRVLRGQLRIGTPLCVRKQDDTFLSIGRVSTIKKNDKDIDVARVNDEISIAINNPPSVTFGRQLTKEDKLSSELSRPSVDAVKVFKSLLTEDDINLLATLIKEQKVPKGIGK